MKKAFLLAMAVLFLIPGLALADDWGVYPGAQVFSSDVQDGYGGYLKATWLGDVSENWKIGVFGLGAFGSGDTKDDYSYDYTQFAAGLQVKYLSRNYWDINTSIGPWWSFNEGSVGALDNSQDDVGVYLTSYLDLYQRRHWKRAWFPETTFFLSGVSVSSTDQEKKWQGRVIPAGEAYENSHLGVRLTQFVYDFDLSQGNRVSPLVMAEVDNRDGTTYWGAGAGLQLKVGDLKVDLIGKYREDPDTRDDRLIGMIAGSWEF